VECLNVAVDTDELPVIALQERCELDFVFARELVANALHGIKAERSPPCG
jgi:hypothetical protein